MTNEPAGIHTEHVDEYTEIDEHNEPYVIVYLVLAIGFALVAFLAWALFTNWSVL